MTKKSQEQSCLGSFLSFFEYFVSGFNCNSENPPSSQNWRWEAARERDEEFRINIEIETERSAHHHGIMGHENIIGEITHAFHGHHLV
jgi:hypothetical protein